MRRLALALLAASLAACASKQATAPAPAAPAEAAPPAPALSPEQADAAFADLQRRYVLEFLRRNPTVSTYLGGVGLDPSLAEAEGRLRDVSPAGVESDVKWLEGVLRELERLQPARPSFRVDREVALSQVRFLLRQYKARRYQERALDTYLEEPFRAVDFALQGMTPTQEGPAKLGTAEEWRALAQRLRAVGPYLAAAWTQLEAGVKRGNPPDPRMLVRSGLEAAASSVEYFGTELPELAAQRMPAGLEGRDALLADVQAAAGEAAKAYGTLRGKVAATFFDAPDQGQAGLKPQFAQDRYALGEAEYAWALKNNLRLSQTAEELYEEGWQVVEATRARTVILARDIGRKRKLRLPADGNAAVRTVMDLLSKDAPRNDDALLEAYRRSGRRLVEYARRTGLFEVPAEYKLDVVPTPLPLRNSVDGAAYYPAPPFKGTGVGRFFLNPTGNDAAALAMNNVHTIADTAAHEGFPGHDWYYKVLTRFRDDIGPVRWLEPGAVEDSSSMWQGSMASEGWALYAEALMAEPRPGALQGFYTPEEKLYQLQWQLYRDLRVPVDVGLHTGRLSFAKAVDTFSEVTDFLPGSCQDPAALALPAKQASCRAAEAAVYRYSKWPTQAVTYRLGKEDVQSLRREAQGRLGPAFDLQKFHLEYMRQGAIPAGYFREQLLEALAPKAE